MEWARGWKKRKLIENREKVERENRKRGRGKRKGE